MLMMLMGISNIYAYIFAKENVGGAIKSIMLSISTDPTVVVCIIIGLMLVIGCFMETIAAMVVIPAGDLSDRAGAGRGPARVWRALFNRDGGRRADPAGWALSVHLDEHRGSAL